MHYIIQRRLRDCSQQLVVVDGTPHHIKELRPCPEPYLPKSENTSEESMKLIQVGSSLLESSNDYLSDNPLSPDEPTLPHDSHITSCQVPSTRVHCVHSKDQAVAASCRSTPKSFDDNELSANKLVLPSDPTPITSHRDH